jgi:RNA polymerase sigma factor (sigma-70 family)
METAVQLPMSVQKTKSVTETIREFNRKLTGFVRKRVASDEDAEDIMQDVWMQLSNLGNIGDLENVSAWLYEVARNKITDRTRKKTNLALEDFVYTDEDGGFNFKEILLLDDTNNPELAFFKEMFWKEFETAMDELPENQRDVFLLNEMEDMTLREIAELKGENLKTIISRKGYAVKHLRNKLNYLYEELNT